MEARLALSYVLISATCIGIGSLVLAPAINLVSLADPQGRPSFLALEAAVALPIAGLMCVLVHRRASHAWRSFLDDRPGVDGDAFAKNAFVETLDYPRRVFVLTATLFPSVGLVFGAVAVWRFSSWSEVSLVMFGLAFGMFGMLAAILAFLVHRRILAPLRKELALRIDDPTERAKLAHFLPMKNKLRVAACALTIVTAYATMSLAMARASDVIKGLATERHAVYIEAILAATRDTGTIEEAVRAAGRRFEPSGLQFGLLDLDGRDLGGALNEVLTADEWSLLRASLPRPGDVGLYDSFAWDSSNHASWIALPSFERILVVVTPEDVIDPDLDAVGLTVAPIALVIVVLGMTIVQFAASDLERSMSALLQNFRRIAAGQLGGATRLESEDEFGVLLRASETTTEALRKLATQLTTSAVDVDDSATDLASAGECLSDGTAAQNRRIGQAASTTDNIRGRAGEVRTAVEGLGAFVDRSSSVVAELRSTSDDLGGQATDLSNRAKRGAQTAGELDGLVRTIDEDAEDLSLRIQETSDIIEGLVAAARSIEQHAEEGSRLARQVADDSSAGHELVHATRSRMSDIGNDAEAALSAVARLHERAKSVDDVVAVIDSLSDESKLVALNAAIVSAQAGDAGRGFSVVAGQMGALADSARRRSREVAQLTTELRAQSMEAVTIVERNATNVTAGVELSMQTDAALAAISASARESGHGSGSIVEAAARQVAATASARELIRRNRAAADSIRGSVGEQRIRTATANEEARTLESVAGGINEASNAHATAASHIASTVEDVRVATAGIEAALREQTASADENSAALADMIEGMQSVEASTAIVDRAVQRLASYAAALRHQVEEFDLEG